MRAVFHKTILIVLGLILVACGGSASNPPSQSEAVATIGAGIAVASPTPRALADVDLESLLVQPGDLPAGVTGAQVRDTPPKMFDGMPKAARAIYQQFAQGDKQIGGVAVFLYEQDADRDAGYQLIAKGMGKADSAQGIGDKAIITKPDPSTAAVLPFFDILFQRCRAVAHIRLGDANLDEAAVTSYAQRLDKRLQSAVC